MSKIAYIIIFFVLFLDKPTSAQTLTLPYRRYDVEHGMPSSDVFSMTRDTKGELWFATDNGVSRFDGLRFRNYFAENGLADNLTVAVESFKDTIFISCYRKGIQKFCNNHFDTTIFNTRLNYIQSYKDKLLFNFAGALDKQGLTLEYKNGVYTKTFNPFLYTAARSSTSAFFHIKDQVLYKNNVVFKQIPKEIDGSKITCIDVFTEGGILLGGVGAYFILNSDNSFTQKTIPELKDTRLFKIVQDKYNRVWFKTNTGEAFVHINGTIQDIKLLLDIEKTVKIRHIYYDESTDNVWVLTNTNGAYCLYNPFIANYNLSTLTNNTVSNLVFDKQKRLWIGTSGTLLLHDNNKFEKVFFPYEANTVLRLQEINNQIFFQTTLKDPNAFLNGTVLSNFRNTPIHACVHLPLFLLPNTDILTAYGDTLRQQGNGSLKKISINSRFDSLFKGFFNTPLNRLNSFLKRSNDTLWAGGYNGLNWQKDEKWGKVAPNSLVLNSIINAIETLPDGRIVVLAEKGLAIYHNNQWVFESDIYKGRDVRKCRNLVVDNKGRWWLATAQGILIFEDEKSYFLNKNNGLVNSRVNYLAFDVLSNCIWVGTNNGLSKIDVSLFEKYNFRSPAINISQISGFDGKNYPLSMSKLPTNNLIVHIAAQDYLNPQSLVYEYQLDNSNWIATDSTLTMPSLSYGKHILTVRGKIDNSDWTQTAPLSMYVQYPFYLRWWFIGLAILAIALFIYWRIKTIKQQNEEKLAYQNQITELKQKGLAAMMNPHFIFNSLNSIQYFVNSNNLLQANEYLAQFGKLIRYNLEASMKTTIILEEELKRLELYLSLEKMRFNFDYTVDVAQNINKNTTEIPSMLVQPFIENAIWHGILPSKRQGVIKIFFLQNIDNQIIIKIEDNGVGFEQSKKSRKSDHIARSLQIINERIEILNKKSRGGNAVVFEELKERGNTKGTLVTLTLQI